MSMANRPPPSGGMTNRQLLTLAAAVTLVATLPFALYAAFGNPASIAKPARIAARVTGAPVGTLPIAAVDDRPRLAIARVEALHIRPGGLRPGDEFQAVVTVRNHGIREQDVRVDVLRSPDEIMPFRSGVQTVPPGKDRVFTLNMIASARYIIGRHYIRRVYLVQPAGFGVAAFTDATPKPAGCTR